MYGYLSGLGEKKDACNQNRLKNYTLIELEVRWAFELADR